MAYKTESAVKASAFMRYAKKVEREELKRNGCSRASVTFTCNTFLMEHGARIEEIQGDTLYISGDWRNALREGAKARKPNAKVDAPSGAIAE